MWSDRALRAEVVKFLRTEGAHVGELGFLRQVVNNWT